MFSVGSASAKLKFAKPILERSRPIATRSLADPPRTPLKARANSAERRMRFSAGSTSGR